MRVSAGKLTEISETRCCPIGDDRAIVIRVGDEVRAYRNRCAHAGARLTAGAVLDGVLTCPVHEWRYRLEDGSHLGSGRKLEPLPVEVSNGEAFVLMPDVDIADADRPRRLLAADRDDTWPNGLDRPDG